MANVLIDTNIVIYAMNPMANSLHIEARNQLKLALQNQDMLYTSWQNIREILAIVTGQQLQNSTQARIWIRSFMARVIVLPDSDSSFQRWLSLSAKYDVKGKALFDCNLVAVMLENGVDTILTHNVKDFKRYKEINIRPLI